MFPVQLKSVEANAPPTCINKHVRRTDTRWQAKLRKGERRKTAVSQARKPSLADLHSQAASRNTTAQPTAAPDPDKPRRKNRTQLAVHRTTAQPIRGQDARTQHDMDSTRAAAFRAVHFPVMLPLEIRHSRLRKSSATAGRESTVAVASTGSSASTKASSLTRFQLALVHPSPQGWTFKNPFSQPGVHSLRPLHKCHSDRDLGRRQPKPAIFD